MSWLKIFENVALQAEQMLNFFAASAAAVESSILKVRCCGGHDSRFSTLPLAFFANQFDKI